MITNIFKNKKGKVVVLGIAFIFLVLASSLIGSDNKQEMNPNSFIGEVGNGWSFDIKEDEKEEVDAKIVYLGNGIIEITLKNHINSMTDSNSYKWDAVLCTNDSINVLIANEKNKGSGEFHNYGNAQPIKVEDEDLAQHWCELYGGDAFEITSKGSKNQFPKKIRLNVSELNKFKIYAGTGSVQIEANAESVATAYGPNENICQNSTGDLHVAYEVDDNDVWYGSSVDGGSTWATKEIYAGTNEFIGILCLPNDDLIVYYLVGGDIDMYKSTDSGASWVGPTTIEDDDIFTQISCASDSNNIAHCCMIEDGDDLWYVNTSDLNSGLEISSADSDHCDIEVDDSNNVYIVVSETALDDLDIMTNSDSWGSRNSVNDDLGAVASTDEDGVSIAIDTDENIHLASIHAEDLQYCNGTTADLTTWNCDELDSSNSYNPDIVVTDVDEVFIFYQTGTGIADFIVRANSSDWMNWDSDVLVHVSSGWASIAQSQYSTHNNISGTLHYVYTDTSVVLYDSLSVLTTDVTPPTYSNAQTNTTTAGESINFSILYNDDIALHPKGQYIFSTNNTGIWINDSTSCYQETANVSTSCGGLSTGVYSVVNDYFYINYTKPSLSVNTSLWQVKFGGSVANPYFENVTIPSSCWDYGSTLQFRFYSILGSAPYFSYGQCYNGTWKNITSISSAAFSEGGTGITEHKEYLYDGNYSTGVGFKSGTGWVTVGWGNPSYGVIYEEAMWWETGTNFTATPQWANVTKTLNSTEGLTIGYRWFAKDSAGNLNNTPIYTLRIPYCYAKNVTQSFTTNNIIDRVGSFFKTLPQIFTLNNLVDKLSNFLKTIIQSFSINSLWCYQESANVSTACGGLNTGNYASSNNGGWVSHGPGLVYDEDWDTYGSSDSGETNEWVFINYSKPANALSSSLWNISIGSGASHAPINLTIHSSCWDYNSSIISLKLQSENHQTYGHSGAYCYNGTWKLLNNNTLDNILYEEGMYWKIVRGSEINVLGNFRREISQFFTTTFLIDRLRTVLREITQSFNLTNLVDRLSNFLKTITQALSINELTERVSSFFRNLINSFNITSLVHRLRSVMRDIPQILNMNLLIERIGNFFKIITQSFLINNVVDRLRSVTKDVTDSFGLNSVVDRVGSFFRTVIDNFTITSLINILKNIIRTIPQSFGLNNIVDRVSSFFKTITQTFSVNELIERVGNFLRNIIQTLLVGFYKSPTTTDGLISWWTFDTGDFNETHAFDVWDSNNGTIYNNVTNNSAGYIGKAFDFVGNSTGSGGIGGYLDCGNATNISNITNEITIEAWIKPAINQELPENQGVASMASDPLSSSTWSWQIRYGHPPENSLGFQLNTGLGSKWVAVGHNLTTDEWYHIVVTFNGSATKFYLNGELKDTNIFDSTTINTNSLNKLLIGDEGWANYFNGTIDEFKIYNESLSEDDISRRFLVIATTYSTKRRIINSFSMNILVDRIGDFFRTATQTLSINNLVDRLGNFFRNIQQYFGLNNIVNRVGSVLRTLTQSFGITNLADRLTSFFKTITQSFSINELTERLRSVTKDITQSFGLNNLVDRIINILRNIQQTFSINALIKGFGDVLRTLTQSFGITDLIDKVGSFFKDIPQSFSINAFIEGAGGVFRTLTQSFNLNIITEKLGSFFKTIPQTFSITSLVERITTFFRDVTQSFGITELTERVINIFRNIQQFFSINAFIEGLGGILRTLTQSFNLTNLTERIGNFFKTTTQSFNITSLVESIGKTIRTLTQSFTLNNIVDKLSNFFKTITQSFSLNTITQRVATFFRNVTDNFGITSITDRLINIIRNISQSFTLNNIISRGGVVIRNIVDSFNLNELTQRVGSFFRNIQQSFSINSLVERLISITRTITQFFQMFFVLFAKPTLDAWAWTTSSETLTQLQAYDGLRVPWGLYDNWTSNVLSPHNWINTTKTYSLPTDCANVQIQIEGENRTYSILVNNTLCDYTVINNNTMTPGSSSNITINYTTTAITSAEGTWIASNKRLSNQTKWINTLTLDNPSTHNYLDISTNITTDQNAIPTWVNITNNTNTEFAHTFNNSDGNTNWSLSELDSGNNYLFYANYKTDNITLNKTNHTETILGKEYDIWNATIEANSTRSITNVYSYFNFTDTGVVANKLYKCSSGLTNCTLDISNRVDTVWEDQDSDGSYDYVEWFITSLAQNQSYQLLNDKGFPVEITISRQILNKPVYIFDNILWRTTLTMYNSNAFATEKIYKYEFPLGSVDIELDDIRKNLQYDPFGSLAPFITVIDKDQSGLYPNSVYLSPGETKTFIIEYRTESVTLDSSTYFPSHFEVDENALIVQILRIKNQAEDNITDVEYRIPIDYGEDLLVCEGEWEKGCPDNTESAEYDRVTIDTQPEVKGDYTLDVDELESGETMYVTLSYYTPTAKVINIERGRRSVLGNLTTFKKIFIESQAKFTMGDIRYKDSEILCENIIEIKKCRITGICDIPLGYTCPLEIKMGVLGMGEEISAVIWFVEKEQDEVVENWITKIWNWGEKITLEGFWVYILGWLADEDPETEELVIPTGRIIIVSIGIIFCIIIAYLLFRRSVKKKRINS